MSDNTTEPIYTYAVLTEIMGRMTPIARYDSEESARSAVDKISLAEPNKWFVGRQRLDWEVV